MHSDPSLSVQVAVARAVVLAEARRRIEALRDTQGACAPITGAGYMRALGDVLATLAADEFAEVPWSDSE